MDGPNAALAAVHRNECDPVLAFVLLTTAPPAVVNSSAAFCSSAPAWNTLVTVMAYTSP
jgi:hypothetical protein